MQFDAGPSELPDGLDEIARVGPEPGVVEGDDQVAGLAGETRHPFHLFPAVRRVFAPVGIAARQDDGVPPVFPHHFADGFHPPCIEIVHGANVHFDRKLKKWREFCKKPPEFLTLRP